MTSGTAALLGLIVGFMLGGVVAYWYFRKQTASLFSGVSARKSGKIREVVCKETSSTAGASGGFPLSWPLSPVSLLMITPLNE